MKGVANKKRIIISLIVLIGVLTLHLFYATASDWPIFKGNIYFTGNNDEIIVKNSNLKWLFQADSHTYNPVVSDGYVYFIDKKGHLYCVDEEFGRLKWKVNVFQLAKPFKTRHRAAGKIKYPLVKGNMIFLTDPVAIYAFDKKTGRAIWARTAMKTTMGKVGLSGSRMRTTVDGIYSDPIISGNSIFYGTRKNFLSREIANGHIKWDNSEIGSYSGFPTFYDKYIITQSMDYSKGIYTVHCLDAASGRPIWIKKIARPFKIFPPVVYKKKVFIPSGQSLFALDIRDGRILWTKNYDGLISSIPGYTDRAILFVLDNKDVYVVSPLNGRVLKRVEVGEKSGPRFVTVRDQLYLAYNEVSKYNGKTIYHGKLKAMNFNSGKELWQFKTPFPGSVSQPAANGGIMFLPAGNYLYAIGTEYYSKVVDGGSGHETAPGSKGEKIAPTVRPAFEKKEHLFKMRDLELAIKNSKGEPLSAVAEIKKRQNGKVVYSKRIAIHNQGEKPESIKIPEGDNVEILISSKGYLPEKVIINKNHKKRDITLKQIKSGKSYVVDNINFEFNQAYLKKESLDIIINLVNIMKRNPSLRVEVRGFTDNKGDAAYNKKLSERRADAVGEYMIKQGISPERITTRGFGEANPIAPNNTREGRAKNRRTEFFFLK